MDITKILIEIWESALYVLFWILIMTLCYVIIDKLTSFSMKKELIEDENIALWIMFAWIFIAIAIIIAAAIK
jgi:uncharacterized membrane protein YjfL (UPF0719 family)